MFDLLYPILDRQTNEKQDVNPLHVIRMWGQIGIRTFQVRDKVSSYIQYIEFCKRIKQEIPESRLIANDYVPIGEDRLLFECIHLGQEDLRDIRLHSLPMIEGSVTRRASLGIGISTHNPEQLQKALTYCPAYVALGPIFTTKSKVGSKDPLVSPGGRKRIFEQFVADGANLPDLVLIGGIKPSNLSSILRECRFTPIPAFIQSALSEKTMTKMLDLVKKHRDRIARSIRKDRALKSRRNH